MIINLSICHFLTTTITILFNFNFVWAAERIDKLSSNHSHISKIHFVENKNDFTSTSELYIHPFDQNYFSMIPEEIKLNIISILCNQSNPLPVIANLQRTCTNFKNLLNSRSIFNLMAKKYFKIFPYHFLERLLPNQPYSIVNCVRNLFHYLLVIQQQELTRLEFMLSQPKNFALQELEILKLKFKNRIEDFLPLEENQNSMELSKVRLLLSEHKSEHNFLNKYILLKITEEYLNGLNLSIIQNYLNLEVNAILNNGELIAKTKKLQLFFNGYLTRLPKEGAELIIEKINNAKAHKIKLYLSDNHFNWIPPEILEIPNLYKLDLRNNQLTYLPNIKTNSANTLESLLLGNYKSSQYLTDLGQQVGVKSSGNRFTEIPLKVMCYKNLRKLDLSSNDLKTFNEIHISQFLPNLLKLNLNYNEQIMPVIKDLWQTSIQISQYHALTLFNLRDSKAWQD